MKVSTGTPRSAHPARDPRVVDALRPQAEQALSRTRGAPPPPGKTVRRLDDAEQNYSAWLEAIHSARQPVHFENYVFDDDAVGRRFADAQMERARAGIRVRGRRNPSPRGATRRRHERRRSDEARPPSHA